MAEDILKDFMGELPASAVSVKPLDIDVFASQYLGLNVAYTRLSDNGEILGLTTYDNVELELERYMNRQTIRVSKNTVLIDDSLIRQSARPERSMYRRRFTIAHECSHQILYRQTPCDERVQMRRSRSCSYSFYQPQTRR